MDAAGPDRRDPACRWTRRRPTVLAASTVLMALSLLVAPPDRTQAATSPGPAPSPTAPRVEPVDPKAQAKRVGFGVVPATADGLDLRAFFSFGLTPGSVAYDNVAVVNYSRKALDLDVYAADAANTAEGGFALGAATDPPVDLGAWVAVAGKRSVAVPGRSADGAPGRVILPVTITVPLDATPGDHAAGIVASLATVGTNPDGQSIQLEQRVAARVYVRVDGPLRPALAITGLEAKYVKGSRPWRTGLVQVTYTVANNGNLRMGFEPSVTVAGPNGLGSRTVAAPSVAELLPGNSQTFSSRVTGVWPTVLLDVTASASPVAAVAAEPPGLDVVTEMIRIWAVTWELLLALFLFLLLLGVLVRRLIRRLRRADVGPSLPETADLGHLGVPVENSTR